jgi:glycosyltransferase involved in cell wall biosynthesis
VRVAHVNLAKGFRGGERQTALLVRELARRDVDQRLVVRRGSEIPTHLSDVPNLETRFVGWPYLHAVKACASADLIHGHDGKSLVTAALAAAVLGKPYVVTRRIQPPPGGALTTRAAYGRAAALVALSRGVRDGLHDYTGRDDIEVIPSASSGLPVDPEGAARLRARYADRFLVVCAAALVDNQKGQSYLIEAARLLHARWPDLRVVLLGEGSDRAAFEDRARNLPCVELPGFVTDLGDWLAAADAFVLPSLQEGLGSVLLDAFEAGLPVVASRIPGVTDLVRDGETGLLVPPRDAGALAAALLRLRGDPALRTRLGETARAEAHAYRPEVMAERYLALYRRLSGLEAPAASDAGPAR